MDEFFLKLRDRLKYLPLLIKLNSAWKARKLKYDLQYLRQYYGNFAETYGIKYSEESALAAARSTILRNIIKSTTDNRRLRVFWVGANLEQDHSGFIQALERFCDVRCFYNHRGEYGLWYKDANGRIKNYDPGVVDLNDRALLAQVEVEMMRRGIDLLIGQMWSNYVSKNVLSRIRAMGVPVINVSMDDRLPENWGIQDGYRLGSVGLVGAVDLVLTTTAESCLWYAVEGCPAIFWPLASDPGVFSPLKELERDIDVLFIGNRYGIRSRIIEYLADQGIVVSCWGGGWQNGYVTAEQSAELFKRAKIILGIGTVGYCEDVFTLKLRDFDAPMSGALYVTHRNPDLTALFREGEDIACYETVEECAEVIHYYLVNPDAREKVARAGYRKALSHHSWDMRIAQTFQAIKIH